MVVYTPCYTPGRHGREVPLTVTHPGRHVGGMYLPVTHPGRHIGRREGYLCADREAYLRRREGELCADRCLSPVCL